MLVCSSALSCAFALLSSVRRSKLGSSSALAFAFALVKYCLRRGLLGVLRGTLQHACSSPAAPRKLAAAVIVSSHAAGAAAGVAVAAAGGEASSPLSSRGGAFCGSGALRSVAGACGADSRSRTVSGRIRVSRQGFRFFGVKLFKNTAETPARERSHPGPLGSGRGTF